MESVGGECEWCKGEGSGVSGVRVVECEGGGVCEWCEGGGV